MSELKATQKGMWKNAYDILLDGNLLTKWDAKTWSVGGTFVLDEHSYEVKANGMATRYEMTDATKGARAATASRVGRKHWSIETDGQTYQFERASLWRLEERLMIDGQPAGSIRRSHLWSGTTSASLPGLPLYLSVFALLVVLSGWDLAANSV